MNWNTISKFSKYRYFETNINTTVNLVTITGLTQWKNPQFFYSFSHCILNNYFVNTEITVKYSYPNVTFTANGIHNSSKINVLVIDDYDFNNVSVKDAVPLSTDEFKTVHNIEFLPEIVTLDASNNFSFDIGSYKQLLKGFNFIPSISEIEWGQGIFEYKFELVNVSGSTYKINLYQKIADKQINGALANSTVNNFNIKDLYSILVQGGGALKGWSNGYSDNYRLLIDDVDCSTGYISFNRYYVVMGDDRSMLDYVFIMPTAFTDGLNKTSKVTFQYVSNGGTFVQLVANYLGLVKNDAWQLVKNCSINVLLVPSTID